MTGLQYKEMEEYKEQTNLHINNTIEHYDKLIVIKGTRFII